MTLDPQEHLPARQTPADHQLLTLDLTLVTGEGQQGAIEAKAAALGAHVTVEDDDFWPTTRCRL